MKYYLGVDVGGTNLVAAVVDENDQILAKASCKTNLPRKPELTVEDIAQVCHQAVEQSGLSMAQMESVGIGVPGIVNLETGVVEYSCNLDYHDVPIVHMLKEKLPLPVFAENDANVAAIGEFAAGAGQGCQSMVAITLGTGVGGGVIIDNKILTGFNYSGGELGHMVIQRGGRLCNCGRRGCLEAYASATGLIQTTIEKMRQYPDSLLWKIAPTEAQVEGKTAFDALQEGDAAAKEAFEEFIDALSCGVVNIIDIFQPEIVCIGGGLSRQGRVLTDLIQKAADQEEYNRDGKHRCKIVTARLGNDAGLIGAALQGKYR